MTHTHITRPNEQVYISLNMIKPLLDGMDIPKTHMEREQMKITRENTSSILPEVVISSSSGNYILVSGYTTYYAYQIVHKPNTLIPCKVFYHLTEDQCYLHTLDWIYKNLIINWNIRNEVITKLTNHFLYTTDDLSAFLHRLPKSIRQYLDPPAHVETQARRQNKENTINKISQEAFLHDHNKEYLYRLTLYSKIDITDEKLKFIGWMRGNGIQFEKRHLTQKQEKQLIDRALNLKEDFIEDIRYTINRMRISNGDNPIF